jgi:hypothetical protein
MRLRSALALTLSAALAFAAHGAGITASRLSAASKQARAGEAAPHLRTKLGEWEGRLWSRGSVNCGPMVV